MSANFFIGNTTIDVALTDEIGNAFLVKGLLANKPSGKPHYAVGCEFIATDTGGSYFNTGTIESCDFTTSGGGGGITALTGDVTASGSGSVTAEVVGFAGVELGATMLAPTNAHLPVYDSVTGKWNGVTFTKDATLANNGQVTVSGWDGQILDGTFVTPADANIPVYDFSTSRWVSVAASGDVTLANTGHMNVQAIQGHPVDGAPLLGGQGYVYDGAGMAPTYQVITQKVSVSSSQMLNIFTTPVTLVPALAGAAVSILSVQAQISNAHAGTPYSGNTHLQVVDSVSGNALWQNENILTGTSLTPVTNFFPLGSVVTGTSGQADSAVVLTTQTGNPGAGTADFNFYITYKYVIL